MTDGQGGLHVRAWKRSKLCERWSVCVRVCVCSLPTPQSHPISTSAAHRQQCNNNITHLISSAYFASPATPSLHIYHIHLIFRNKCSRKRIMHLLCAPFITDTFTWGFASMVSNGALFAGLPYICQDGVRQVGVAVVTLALSVSDDKWADISISAVTFIKEIWPSSGESCKTL